jgi:hypoxanthine phosphoribosyltransferase
MKVNKVFVSAQQLLEDSFKLAEKVYASNYCPSHIVGVWRGGTPVAIAVHELLDVLGVKSEHLAIKTSSYSGIGERGSQVTVQGLGDLIDSLDVKSRLLLVDDVHDSGFSLQQVVVNLRAECGSDIPEIRLATPYFKPKNNKSSTVPDYYIHETDEWLVFPHEIQGLSLDEIKNDKPELAFIVDELARLQQQ